MSETKQFKPFHWINREHIEVSREVLEQTYEACCGIDLLAKLITVSNLAREDEEEGLLSVSDTSIALMTIRSISGMISDRYEDIFRNANSKI